jgi:hypothetical protein
MTYPLLGGEEEVHGHHQKVGQFLVQACASAQLS